MTVASDLLHCRGQFPLIDHPADGAPLIYLDSAATAQKPQRVIDALQEFYRSQYGTVNRAVYRLASQSTHRFQATRELIARFLGAQDPREIIFTRGTTDALNLVAHTLGKGHIQPGDEILICETEHHANIVPWQLVALEREAIIKPIPVDDQGCIDMQAFEALLSDRTRVVAVAHIANTTGTVHPIKQIAQLAHPKGALVVVDGAQAVPHMEVDVVELDADFYAFSGHKLYGPTGVGALYGKLDILEPLPPYQGGGDMIDRVSFEGTTFAEPPQRFEAGTPMIAQVIGLGAAIEFVQELGMEQIAEHEQILGKHAAKLLSQIDGLRMIGTAPDKAPLNTFVIDGLHPLDIGTLLDLQGICVRTGHHCAQPTMQRFGIESSVRASYAVYNTVQEVERFVDVLQLVVKQLRG